ncbi:MAG: O-antigen ligase family protein [Bacteroidales bacterium]|nr:O-antigen ligase family protein [Bacteroidales bacterium]
MFKRAWSYLKDLYKVDAFSFWFGIIKVSAVVGFVPNLPKVGVYIVLALFAVYCLTKMRSITILPLLLLLYIPIEIILARPDAVFQSWQRYVLFALLLIDISPLFEGVYLRRMRRQIMLIVLWTCTVIGVGSFFARFLGINYMTFVEADVFGQVGTFGGLTHHSILLGLISGVGAVFMAYNAYGRKKKLYWLLMVMCLFSILFSASRVALLASFVGIVMALYKMAGNAGKFAKLGVAIAIIAVMTFPLWDGALSGILEKNGGDLSAVNMDSREVKWNARLAEFSNSPVYGVGFVSIDPNSADAFSAKNGVIEPGSSWLSILSMLGLLGALLIVPFFIKSYLNVWKSSGGFQSVVVGVLTLLYVHMFAEGYIFSGGSFECFLLWLTVGVAYDSKYPSNVLE